MLASALEWRRSRIAEVTILGLALLRAQIAIVVPFLPVLAVRLYPLEELLAGILHVFMGRVE